MKGELERVRTTLAAWGRRVERGDVCSVDLVEGGEVEGLEVREGKGRGAMAGKGGGGG